jgi:hypothetical protein
MPIELKVTLPNGGLGFRGTHLPVKVEVLNGSDRPIEKIGITISSNTVFNVKGQTLQRKTPMVNGLVLGGIVPPRGFYIKMLAIDIPPMIESSITLGTLVSFLFLFEW